MPTRRWYAEPETFIAVAALVVSVSAVVVGIYEASLQRHHDRAEVWPHLEIQVFTKEGGAQIDLENSGIGPALVQSVTVTVDGKPMSSWSDVLRSLNGADPAPFGNFSAVGHGLRPGDRLSLIDMPIPDMPHDFWNSIGRVGVSVRSTSDSARVSPIIPARSIPRRTFDVDVNWSRVHAGGTAGT